MSEWSKEHDWKSCMSRKGHRGFESLSLQMFLCYKNRGCTVWIKSAFDLLKTLINKKRTLAVGITISLFFGSCMYSEEVAQTTTKGRQLARLIEQKFEEEFNGFCICLVVSAVSTYAVKSLLLNVTRSSRRSASGTLISDLTTIGVVIESSLAMNKIVKVYKGLQETSRTFKVSIVTGSILGAIAGNRAKDLSINKIKKILYYDPFSLVK